ncbi:MAG: hypothetical protein GY861_23495 [bacterium]|nr:hypothetical protein [bacterium]
MFPQSPKMTKGAILDPRSDLPTSTSGSNICFIITDIEKKGSCWDEGPATGLFSGPFSIRDRGFVHNFTLFDLYSVTASLHSGIANEEIQELSAAYAVPTETFVVGKAGDQADISKYKSSLGKLPPHATVDKHVKSSDLERMTKYMLHPWHENIKVYSRRKEEGLPVDLLNKAHVVTKYYS